MLSSSSKAAHGLVVGKPLPLQPTSPVEWSDNTVMGWTGLVQGQGSVEGPPRADVPTGPSPGSGTEWAQWVSAA